jgi:hypothetical protein
LKNLCEHEESPIKDGICTICSKPAPWHRLNQSVDVSQTDSSTAGGSGGSQVMQGIPVRDSSIDERLKTASEKVIKISSVFSSLGSVLNIANHVLAVLLLCATFALRHRINDVGLGYRLDTSSSTSWSFFLLFDARPRASKVSFWQLSSCLLQ